MVEQKSEILEITKVHPFPLVTARSMAHSDKLDVTQNNIYVSLLETDVSSYYFCVSVYNMPMLLWAYPTVTSGEQILTCYLQKDFHIDS